MKKKTMKIAGNFQEDFDASMELIEKNPKLRTKENLKEVKGIIKQRGQEVKKKLEIKKYNGKDKLERLRPELFPANKRKKMRIV